MLLQLHPQERDLAEKAITDVLFEASRGTLDRNSVNINKRFSFHSLIASSDTMDSVDTPAYRPSLQQQASSSGQSDTLVNFFSSYENGKILK